MTKKLKEFQEGFVNQQYKLIDEIIKQQEQLNLTDRKESAVYFALNGVLLGITFRLKGIINSIKEISGDNIEISEKYQNLFKSIKEPAYFKGDELIILLAGEKEGVEKSVNDLINEIKTSKNGEQGKKDDTK